MIRVLLVNEMRPVSNVIASVLEDEPDIKVAKCIPIYIPFLYLDI